MDQVADKMHMMKKGIMAVGHRTKDAANAVTHQVADVVNKQVGGHHHNPMPAATAAPPAMPRTILRSHQYIIGNKTIVEERQISEGGFAYVSLVKESKTGEDFALKKMPCPDKDKADLARREVALLEKLPRHPHLVGYHGSIFAKNEAGAYEALLLFELCPGGHLLHLLEKHNGQLEEKLILSVFSQLCSAVSVLHAMDPPVQHRDLKVENVLLGADGKWKLCDFGSWSDRRSDLATLDRDAQSALEEEIDRYTTMMYRPPEMVDFFQQLEITEKVDIWMLGCILFTLMFYRHPFQDESVLAIKNVRYDMPLESTHSLKLKDLTRWLLSQDPKVRPSAQQLLEILEHFDDPAELPLPPAVVAAIEKQERLYGVDRQRERPLSKSDASGTQSSDRRSKKDRESKRRGQSDVSWNGSTSSDVWGTPAPGDAGGGPWAAAPRRATAPPADGLGTGSWSSPWAGGEPAAARTSSPSKESNERRSRQSSRQGVPANAWAATSPTPSAGATPGGWDPFGLSQSPAASSTAWPPAPDQPTGSPAPQASGWPPAPSESPEGAHAPASASPAAGPWGTALDDAWGAPQHVPRKSKSSRASVQSSSPDAAAGDPWAVSPQAVKRSSAASQDATRRQLSQTEEFQWPSAPANPNAAATAAGAAWNPWLPAKAETKVETSDLLGLDAEPEAQNASLMADGDAQTGFAMPAVFRIPSPQK